MSESTQTSGASEQPERGWEELARAAGAGQRRDPDEVELLRELLSFVLDGTSYAIPVERVREIVRVGQITRVPRVPPAVLGVIALRGEIVQVVDLRMRLRLPTTDTARSSRIIVLHGDDDRVAGVLVDAVQAVLRVSEDAIHAAAGAEGGAVSEMCVRGDEFVSILELDRVLSFEGAEL